MAKQIPKLHVRPMAWKFLLWAIVIFLAIDALSKFGVYDATRYINPYFIPLVAGLFILLDVGLWQRKGKGLGVSDWISVIIAGFVLLGVILGFFGVESATLSGISGVAELVVGIAVIYNIFKK